MIDLGDLDGELLDRYAEGEAGGQLEIEYRQLRHIAGHFSEKLARRALAPTLPTALELISALAAALLPHGPAPSLSDALHALDRSYAAWQAEEPPFQRIQARRLAVTTGQLLLLHALLAAEPGD